ncbi:glycosyltransferase family 87 protein [Knoellia remsis]|uniref:glycosyltransferase family 87 protein n=1 Tax=Knoellia remsis TaxID=407159 RepID=UPI000D0685CF|nr:glycosyltransferase family 87 protein [Knoellia remsis]
MRARLKLSPAQSRLFLWAGVLASTAAFARMVRSDWLLAQSFNVGVAGDISVYQGALQNWRDGGALYEWENGAGFGFTYPPFAAIVMTPVTWLDPERLGDIWTVLDLLFAGVLVALIFRASQLAWGRVGTLAAYLAAVAMFLGSSQFQSEIINGQVNVVLALLIVLDLGASVPERWRGVLTGVAAAIKLTPLVAIAWLVLTRQWRSAALASFSFIGLGALAWLVYPDVSKEFWTRAVLDTGRVGRPDLPANASVFGVLSRAGLEGLPRTVLWLTLGTALVLAAFYRAEQARRRGDHISAAILVMCAAVLASPISWPHHQIWLPLAGIALILHRGWRVKLSGAVVLVFCVLHIPLSRAFDQAGPFTGALDSIDFMMFAMICVLGLGSRDIDRDGPATREDGIRTGGVRRRDPHRLQLEGP